METEQLVWTTPEWLAEATAWIRSELDDRGIALTGPFEQPHVYWWSTALRVPTSEGSLWFKAAQEIHRFEIPLTLLLASLRPEVTAVPIAVDAGRGWMLSRDAGTRLREHAPGIDQLAHWDKLLPRYAQLQIELAPRTDELLALGVPDHRLAVLPAQLAEALADRDSLVGDWEDALTTDEYERVRALAPEFEALCRRLADYAIPETLQHDDFHDGNLFVRDGEYVFFDWGDSCISHPFHTMVVALRALAWRLRPAVEPGSPELLRLRDVYLEPWSAYGSRPELQEAFALAYRTGTIARALTWRRFVLAREPAHRGEYLEAVSYGLKLFLENGPIGSYGRWD